VNKRAHLECGCRRTTVKRMGHRPGCAQFDMERFVGRRARRRFERNWAERGASLSHARDVMLAR
jgi:hypothetical protein